MMTLETALAHLQTTRAAFYEARDRMNSAKADTLDARINRSSGRHIIAKHYENTCRAYAAAEEAHANALAAYRAIRDR